MYRVRSLSIMCILNILFFSFLCMLCFITKCKPTETLAMFYIFLIVHCSSYFLASNYSSTPGFADSQLARTFCLYARERHLPFIVTHGASLPFHFAQNPVRYLPRRLCCYAYAGFFLLASFARSIVREFLIQNG